MRSKIQMLIALALAGCGTSSTGGGMKSKLPPLEGSPGGFVTYVVNGQLVRHPARENATPVNLTEQIDALSPVTASPDRFAYVSKDGAYLTMESSRFGCARGECLTIVNGQMTEGEVVLANGQEIDPVGRAAISNDGNLIVYPSGAGPNAEDLYAITRTNGVFGAPLLLTGDSQYDYNNVPTLRADNSTVLFDCGSSPFSQEDTNICEVAIDGSGFRRVVDGDDGPAGQRNGRAHHADYFSDGSIVFEGEWGGEQIWVLRPDVTIPENIRDDHGNDNSPCVLPGGYVASLWLGRPGAQGFHELKMTAPSGGDFTVLTPDVDVEDVGISCHGPTTP
jgi:hypothetical protein